MLDGADDQSYFEFYYRWRTASGFEYEDYERHSESDVRVAQRIEHLVPRDDDPENLLGDMIVREGPWTSVHRENMR